VGNYEVKETNLHSSLLHTQELATAETSLQVQSVRVYNCRQQLQNHDDDVSNPKCGKHVCRSRRRPSSSAQHIVLNQEQSDKAETRRIGPKVALILTPSLQLALPPVWLFLFIFYRSCHLIPSAPAQVECCFHFVFPWCYTGRLFVTLLLPPRRTDWVVVSFCFSAPRHCHNNWRHRFTGKLVAPLFSMQPPLNVTRLHSVQVDWCFHLFFTPAQVNCLFSLVVFFFTAASWSCPLCTGWVALFILFLFSTSMLSLQIAMPPQKFFSFSFVLYLFRTDSVTLLEMLNCRRDRDAQW